ncbi:MAG: hypothetical protein ACF8XB_10050 [Planctomycetota bacterium JB042]
MTVRALISPLLALAAALSLSGCCFFPGFCAAPFPIDVVFSSLDDDRVPLELVSDGEKKDVKRKDRVKYKPAKGEEGATLKRYRMTAKEDGAAATERFDRRLEGEVSVFTRVAIHETKGLESGVSTAFLQRSPESGVVARVEATWNAEILGFTVRARVDGTPVGAPVDFPQAEELFLTLTATPGGVELGAARPDGPGHDDFETPTLLTTVPVAMGEVFRAELGVEGLGKKGTYYFSDFTTRSKVLPAAGDEELVGLQLAKAMSNCTYVLAMFAHPPPHDMTLALNYTASNGLFLDLAADELAAAAKKGTLDPDTDVDELAAALAKADAKMSKAISKVELLFATGKTSGKSAVKRIEKARDEIEVVFGKLFGYRGGSSKTLRKTIEIE